MESKTQKISVSLEGATHQSAGRDSNVKPYAPPRRIGNHMQQRRFIRINELASTSKKRGLIPASPATVWRWVKAKTFPAPLRLSPRVTAWDEAQIEAWLTDTANKPVLPPNAGLLAASEKARAEKKSRMLQMEGAAA